MKKIDWNLLNESIVWWEKQRLAFNVVVGITGILSLIIFAYDLNIIEIIGVFIWGLSSFIGIIIFLF